MPHVQLRAFSVPKHDLSRIEQCCVGGTAIRFNAADTGLDLFIRNWITTHLVCNIWKSIAVLTGTSNSQVPSTKWKTWWNAVAWELNKFDNVQFRGNSSFVQTRWLFANSNIHRPFLLISRAQGVSGENETTCPSTMARAQCSRVGLRLALVPIYQFLLC